VPALSGPERKLAAAGFDISPHGRTVIYSRVDSLESDIVLVETFRCRLTECQSRCRSSHDRVLASVL